MMIMSEINGLALRSTPWLDRVAIGASFLCLIHCLLLPILFMLLPSLGATLFANESVHLWLVYLALPASLLALGIGCAHHKRSLFVILGALGLCSLVFGIAVEPLGLKHSLEPLFTALGALLIMFAHVRNFQLCHNSKNCECH